LCKAFHSIARYERREIFIVFETHRKRIPHTEEFGEFLLAFFPSI